MRSAQKRTGHAEAVRITYDPAQISYAQLLQIFFTVAHDPTAGEPPGAGQRPELSLARSSRSRRSRRSSPRAFIARLNAAHAFKAPIATRIENGGFYPAEAYHQDFARKHPYYPYIVVNDRPKVAALKAAHSQPLQGVSSAKQLRFHALFRLGATKAARRPI